MRKESFRYMFLAMFALVGFMLLTNGRPRVLWPLCAIFGGIVALNMPAEFLRGYDSIKDNAGELRRFGCLRVIVGYGMIAVGLLFALAWITGAEF